MNSKTILATVILAAVTSAAVSLVVSLAVGPEAAVPASPAVPEESRADPGKTASSPDPEVAALRSAVEELQAGIAKVEEALK